MTDSDAQGSNRQFEPPHTTPGKYCPSCHRIYIAPEAEANFCAKDGAQLVIDQRIFGDKYVLGEPLGFGHMSEVYVATQAGIGRKVALKLLRSEHETSSEMRKRFEREAQIASSLDHPNAVTIFESGHTSDGQSYIAMELLGGETLDRLIEREAPMPVGRALELIIPAVRALAAAHSRNIIHRDVKPENIFVAHKRLSVGTEEVVKVLDFGIARVLGRKTRVTATQTALGTPHYMAPETLQGEEATTQSDVYAVGVILTEMLTGKLPWGESSRSEISTVMARMVAAPQRLLALLPSGQFPDDLQRALDQFLSLKLDDRPVDCAVALQILLQIGISVGSIAALSMSSLSSISVPPLASGRQPISAPPSNEGAQALNQEGLDRPTQPIRSATAVLQGTRVIQPLERPKWLLLAAVLGALALTMLLWVQQRPFRASKRPEVATAAIPIAAEPPPKEQARSERATAEPTAPKQAVKSDERLHALTAKDEKKASAHKHRRHTKRTKLSGSQSLLYPLDTKGY